MAGTMVAGDLENIIATHQQAAASKPLNQTKTPGNKLGKVSFRDENAFGTIGKPAFKTLGGPSIGEKQAVKQDVTPMTRNRAPLGAKTTNAKGKAFQTPAGLGKDGNKIGIGSASRRPKVRLSVTEPVKIDVLNEDDIPEIEYMPPPVQDLPDIPDECENPVNLSMFKADTIQKDFLRHLRKTSSFELKQRELSLKISELQDEAAETYRQESQPWSCSHVLECETEECQDMPARLRSAKERYDLRMAEIEKMRLPTRPADNKAPNTKPAASRVDITKGPSMDASRRAASALSMPKSRTTTIPTRPVTKPWQRPGLLDRSQAPAQPQNPSAMHHAASVAASNSTIGYGRGRAARVNLRQGILSPKDSNLSNSLLAGKSTTSKAKNPNTLSPAEYMRVHGEPKFLSEMWWKCRTAGLIKMPGEEEEKTTKESTTGEVVATGGNLTDMDQDEEEFQLVLPEGF